MFWFCCGIGGSKRYEIEEEFRRTYQDAGISDEKRILQLKELQINCFFDLEICILAEELAVILEDMSEPGFLDASVEAAYRRAGEE